MLLILAFAIVLAFGANVFYRVLINQNQVVELKAKMKELEKKSKDQSPEQKKAVLSEIMKYQSELMRKTMRPMFLSLIIVIIGLSWLGSLYADRFAILENGAGNFVPDQKSYALQKTDKGLMINQIDCGQSCTIDLDAKKWLASLDADKVRFQQAVISMPISFPILGSNIAWFWWYVITSIPFVIISRKVMGIKV